MKVGFNKRSINGRTRWLLQWYGYSATILVYLIKRSGDNFYFPFKLTDAVILVINSSTVPYIKYITANRLSDEKDFRKIRFRLIGGLHKKKWIIISIWVNVMFSKSIEKQKELGLPFSLEKNQSDDQEIEQSIRSQLNCKWNPNSRNRVSFYRDKMALLYREPTR